MDTREAGTFKAVLRRYCGGMTALFIKANESGARQVVRGHVTKTCHLELRVEYCGKKSFSVRHKEEKYTLLAEQV